MLKNIVIVNDFDYVQGGASKVAIQTANQIVKKNENINVYFFSGFSDNVSTLDKRVKKIVVKQCEVLKEKNRIKAIFYGIYNFYIKKELKKLLLTLDNTNTIVHIHGWTKVLTSSVFDILFKLKFKVILTLHDYFTACPNGGYFNYKKNEICTLNPLSFKCICCNCDSRNYAFKIYRLIRQAIQNKVVKLNHKIEYVIGISDLSINVLKRTLNQNVRIEKIYNPIKFVTNDRAINFLKNNYYVYVGRVSKEKGVIDFCKALTITNNKGIVVGDGADREKLEIEYPNIKFVGWKNEQEVDEYIRKAKCLIFPSLWYEGAPLTPLEAMRYGIPCIISGKCSGKEYIVNGKNGFIYNNFNELIDSINNFESIIKEDDIFMINKEILRKFDENIYTEKIFSFYKEILKDEKRIKN